MKLIITLVLLSYMNLSYALESIVLDDFEEPTIRVVNDAQTDPKKRFLWNQFEGDPTEGPDIGTASINTDAQNSYSGQNSLKVNVTAGNIYLQAYTHNGGGWLGMQSFTTGWTNDKYNELHIWMKLPPGISKSGFDRKNLTLGTYIRATTGSFSSAEDGGGHYYHSYKVASTGEWQKIIVDMHPDHVRGASGGAEHDYVPYRTNEPGYNYFDTMTRFYFEIDGQLAAQNTPADFYIDKVELVQNTDDENYEQVSALTGVYIPGTNTISVNWRRRKDEPGAVHELRYSFSDIHATGWSNATPFAGSSSATGSNWDYAGMEFVDNSVDLANNQSVFIAIKPENSNRFRQIEIPIQTTSIPGQSISGQCMISSL